jgi:peptide methionine sulfoxide reductase MsrB
MPAALALRAAVAGLAAAVAAAETVELASFDGAPGTTFKFTELNDPVMGGKSTGTWHIDQAGKYGVFDGEVNDVPSLKAPGFIKTAADGRFPDASSTDQGSLVLEVRSSTPSYAGFRVSLASGTMSPAYACSGGGSIPLSRGCFKAKFSVPEGGEFAKVRIPFAAFSDRWSPATGELTKTCEQDKSACVTAHVLKNIKRLELWAEGALGDVHLEVRSIIAEGPAVADLTAKATRPPSEFDTCSGPVQPSLRFGISGRTTPDIPVPVDENETLAEAVCCDNRTKVYAEPQFLYQAPDISLYSKLDQGVTTFYDSVCGVPLFRAPMNRSLADFKADTDEHGWPSFRSAEVVQEHVRTDAGGFVYSSCGTHLGSFLPDAKGSRWCMELSCIAGSPADHASTVVV